MVNADPVEAPAVAESSGSQVNGTHENGSTNGANGTNGVTSGYLRHNTTLQERQEMMLAQWETFPVEYNGRGRWVDSDEEGCMSNEMLSSDENGEHAGYDQLNRSRRYRRVPATHESDSSSDDDSSSDSDSDMDAEDGVVTAGTNSDQESHPVVPQQSATTETAVPAETFPPANDIPLDEEKVSTIRAAMATFTLQAPPDMPDDSKLLEMVKNMQ